MEWLQLMLLINEKGHFQVAHSTSTFQNSVCVYVSMRLSVDVCVRWGVGGGGVGVYELMKPYMWYTTKAHISLCCNAA